MRKNLGAKPAVYPMPVLMIATWDEAGQPDVMNAAWGGISESDEISICISEDHKTTANILARGAFTVSMATEETVIPCDYVGIVSANEVPDKFTRAGFHAAPAGTVDAPIIEELPMTLECRLRSYDPKTCRLVGEIVNISADACILDDGGKIDPKKLRPISFDPISHRYYSLGEPVGIAFSDGKKLK